MKMLHGCTASDVMRGGLVMLTSSEIIRLVVGCLTAKATPNLPVTMDYLSVLYDGIRSLEASLNELEAREASYAA